MIKKNLDFSSKRHFEADDKDMKLMLGRANINPRILLDGLGFDDFMESSPSFAKTKADPIAMQEFNVSLNQGKGITLSGSGYHVVRFYYEILRKFATNIDLGKRRESNIKVHNFHLVGLLDILKDRSNKASTNTRGDRIYDFSCIGIYDFYKDEHEEGFLDRYDRAILQNFILDRIADGVAFHLVTHPSYAKSKFWSREFMEEINRQNHLIVI